MKAILTVTPHSHHAKHNYKTFKVHSIVPDGVWLYGIKDTEETYFNFEEILLVDIEKELHRKLKNKERRDYLHLHTYCKRKGIVLKY